MIHANQVGLDTNALGGRFLICRTIDLIVIALLPAAAFKRFGVAVTSHASYRVKRHSPATPRLIDYGLLWLRPWAWGLSLAYAACGLVRETMHQLLLRLHPIGSELVATTRLFVAYVIWGRALFTNADLAATQHHRVSKETH